MTFKPFPCSTRWEGLAASLWIVLIDLLLVVWAVRRPVDALKYLLLVVLVASLPILVHLLYRTWAAFTLEYWLDRNTLTVRWANMRHTVPLPSIIRITEAPALNVGRTAPWSWPAPFVRSWRDDAGDLIDLYATRPAAEGLLIESTAGLLLLTPADAPGFLAALQERYAMGPAVDVPASRSRQSWLDRRLPTDRTGGWLLGIGLLGVLILFGVLMIGFPNLPDVLTVRYNSEGLPEEISRKVVLFRLPVIGALAWFINGVLGLWAMARRQRMGAYMLWSGAIVVELFSLLALVSLIA